MRERALPTVYFMQPGHDVSGLMPSTARNAERTLQQRTSQQGAARRSAFCSAAPRSVRSRYGRWRPLLAVTACVLGFSPMLAAQPGTGTNAGPGDPPAQYPACLSEADEPTMQAAQGAFQAGNASFNEADYPRAIFYWEDAYRRDCSAHAMLKNLARAYELNEQYEHAIRALDTFLARNPDTTERDAIQSRIENLRKKQDERERAAAAEAAKKQAAETAKTPPPAPAPSRNVLDEAEQFPPEEESSGRSPLPLVFAGVGAAVGVVGGALWYSALQDVEAVEEECNGGRRCADDIAQRGNDAIDRQIRWAIVAGAGAALAAGGVIWYFAQSDGNEVASIAPSVTPHYAGVNLQGSF